MRWPVFLLAQCIAKKYMSDNLYKYIWRCQKCSYHFANFPRMEGLIIIEKKCPKCKSLNILTIKDKEIFIQCKAPENLQEYNFNQENDYPYV